MSVATEVKWLPMLFCGDMVRAILEERKTQTRRIVKWKPVEKGLNLQFTGLQLGNYFTGNRRSGWVLQSRDGSGVWNNRTLPWHCPYGKPGDCIWVRETWRAETDWLDIDNLSAQADIRYEADADDDRQHWRGIPERDRLKWTRKLSAWVDGKDTHWRPSIFMPRWASRISLEITEVRVERLQEISEEDAIAEGAQCAGVPASLTNRGAYAKLWESINGKGSWELNPWVAAISFKRINLA